MEREGREGREGDDGGNLIKADVCELFSWRKGKKKSKQHLSRGRGHREKYDTAPFNQESLWLNWWTRRNSVAVVQSNSAQCSSHCVNCKVIFFFFLNKRKL